MVSSWQWLVRWGCLAMIAVGTLMHMIGMAAPFWVKEEARPAGFPAFVQLLKRQGVGPEEAANGSQPVRRTTRAEARVGLWRWCVGAEIDGIYYSACETPPLSDFPGWWRACQAMSMVGLLMGLLASLCAGLEVYYTRRGVRFSGLAVLCAICCFVAVVGTSLSHGIYSTRYMENLLSIIHLPIAGGGGVSSTFPPLLDWAFGLGAAGATLIGATGILLVAFITRTYPAYQRTENVVV